jgi:acid phosphatase
MMNKLKLKITQYCFFTLSLLSLSCAPELLNLDTAKKDVASYYESGLYEKDLTEIVENAEEKFSRVIVEPNSVVIFDVDETALDNYEGIKQMGFGYEKRLWDEWIEKADAPAVLSVKRLYDFLVMKGFKIIFITGRKNYQHDATIKNLKLAGYNEFDTLITRDDYEHKISAVEFKSQKRKELLDKGYKIAGCVGDQYSDFEGNNCGIIIKLPNYLYIVQ